MLLLDHFVDPVSHKWVDDDPNPECKHNWVSQGDYFHVMFKDPMKMHEWLTTYRCDACGNIAFGPGYSIVFVE